ncbi:glycoside hydrolase family 3 protein [Aquabacterium sp.]|uniref:glycoside hydrolase family 3 protein n=1 Tax=Aquabacterium sp. TaxID=1872578 RepID=UPI002CC7AC13|nr:glycoside hydrolase family 3 N-terminal domain-containing protein [Aquabacterium sp.]HSW05894.1 glycoside hydrolase family 3 N-terminal domain-containing protein [Aquabacterium sp.]
MNTDALALPPFNLSPEDIAWVRRTRDSLGMEEKVRQLFVLAHFRDLPGEVPAVMATRPGGVHRAWGADARQAWLTTRAVLEHSEIPPLITGDLEGGAYGHGCGTPMPNPMAVAAMNDLALSREVARTLAAESRAMGFDWSFTPVIDINQRPDSAIVGTRSYGDDVDTILAQSLVHVQEMQAQDLACTAKHWPGEGYDARDQHLLTTVNPLGWDDWTARFGRLYRGLIDAGVLAVMAGHIAFPAGVLRLNPQAGRHAYRPASISHEMNTLLLRRELGFNGIVISDATAMAGLTTWADRAELVPQVIESGCDVFLFSLDAQGDLDLMLRGLREGRLSEARVEEAVTRVLALKARLGLHRRSIDERLRPLDEVLQRLRTPSHLDVAERAAAASVTLVKDQGVLPLTPQRHRRVVVISPGIETHWVDSQPRPLQDLLTGLSARGFEVRAFDPAQMPTPADTDLVLYLLAKESLFSRGRVFLDWLQLHGNDPRKAMRRFWTDIPTVIVSFGHAGYLLDAPRAPAYINAYTATEPVQRAVLRKLLGDEAFTGRSPIDAFCGQVEAHW